MDTHKRFIQYNYRNITFFVHVYVAEHAPNQLYAAVSAFYKGERFSFETKDADFWELVSDEDLELFPEKVKAQRRTIYVKIKALWERGESDIV